MHRRRRCVRAIAAVAVFAASIAAQNERPDWFAKIEKDNRLLALQWQRAADGALQWRDPAEEPADYRPLFVLEPLLAPIGPSPLAALLHHGDLLSLTDAETHLQRLGVATTTAELLRFVRRPLPSALPELDELDRRIAVDLLRQRGGKDESGGLAAIAGDKKLSDALRKRTTPPNHARQRLAAATLPLPSDADLLIAFDHAQGATRSHCCSCCTCRTCARQPRC